MSVGLSLAWATTVLGAFRRHQPPPRRVGELATSGRVGRGRLPRDRAVSPMARRLTVAAVATLAVWFVLAPAAPLAGVVAWAVPVWRARGARRRADDTLAGSLPEVVDLFSVAVGAGLTVPLAVAAVGARAPGPIGAALVAATDAMAAGRRCGDALDEMAVDCGAVARPLFDALRASERYGAPLGDALARISDDVRADRRRRAEERARRVPVALLFPLVLCVLPAFALLTMAPLLAGTFGSLRL